MKQSYPPYSKITRMRDINVAKGVFQVFIYSSHMYTEGHGGSLTEGWVRRVGGGGVRWGGVGVVVCASSPQSLHQNMLTEFYT